MRRSAGAKMRRWQVSRVHFSGRYFRSDVGVKKRVRRDGPAVQCSGYRSGEVTRRHESATRRGHAPVGAQRCLARDTMSPSASSVGERSGASANAMSGFCIIFEAPQQSINATVPLSGTRLPAAGVCAKREADGGANGDKGIGKMPTNSDAVVYVKGCE